jgi:lipopolysaccharide/colanic/teichoic acid biosynthesis glycosyltransferase
MANANRLKLSKTIAVAHAKRPDVLLSGMLGTSPPAKNLSPRLTLDQRIMKRAMDVFFSGLLILLLAPVILFLTGLILLRDGRPVLYISDRMKGVGQPFRLLKFRTMAADTDGPTVGGAHVETRITPTGATLRRYRLDEIPQLWNILRGDMSFVGARPPLPRYVDMHPDLYRVALRTCPGVTGLATLAFHHHEELILASCKNLPSADHAYRTRCVPRKARLDMIYQERRSMKMDFALVFQTIGNLTLRRSK